jgi:hypothetical protein
MSTATLSRPCWIYRDAGQYVVVPNSLSVAVASAPTREAAIAKAETKFADSDFNGSASATALSFAESVRLRDALSAAIEAAGSDT